MAKTAKSKNKTLKINGVKFHQAHLNLLKAENEADTLYSSEIVMFMVLLFYCDDLGRIRLKGNESIIKSGEERTGIPYNTLYTGFQRLLERKLVTEEIEKGKPVYVIKDYAALNSYIKQDPGLLENTIYAKNSNITLNYFYLPEWVLDAPTNPLKQLVTAKDAQGLLVLLDVLNAFSRDLRFNNGSSQCLTKRSMSWLKERLNRNAKKVRLWAERVSDIFSFAAADEKKRQPKNRTGQTKKNNPIQIVISAFNFLLNINCLYEEKEDSEKVKLRAAVRKDLTHQARYLDIDYDITPNEIQGMVYTFEQVVINTLSAAPLRPADRTLYTMSILKETIDAIDHYYKQSSQRMKNFKIDSLGALFRTILRSRTIQIVRHELEPFERESLFKKINEHREEFPAISKMLSTTI